MLSPRRNVVSEGDKRTFAISGTDNQAVTVLGRISLIGSELKLFIVVGNEDFFFLVADRRPQVNFIAADAYHLLRIGRMPLAFVRYVPVEERLVAVPVEKAETGTAVRDHQQGLIRVPGLRTRVAMRAKGLPAHKARRQLTPRIGDAREGRAESGIGRGLEILGFGQRRGHE